MARRFQHTPQTHKTQEAEYCYPTRSLHLSPHLELL